MHTNHDDRGRILADASPQRSDSGGQDIVHDDAGNDLLLTLFLDSQTRHKKRVDEVQAEMTALGERWLIE